MKVILSRKGFDSEYGGCPSPIFSDGSMLSLPIPSSEAQTTYNQISSNGRNMGPLVESLTNGRLTNSSRTHFDPDLDYDAMPRLPGWLPAFGQVSSALTHLENSSVCVGDLFLFFGWFRNVDENNKEKIRISANASNLHVIFGWLQVGEILDVGIDTAAALASKPWLEHHPHVIGVGQKQNKIYIATEHLSLPLDTDRPQLSGGGMFSQITNNRILTKPDQDKRTLWQLPEIFAPERGVASLTYHGNSHRWKPSSIPGKVTMQSVSKGQEFVLQISDEVILNKWLTEVFG